MQLLHYFMSLSVNSTTKSGKWDTTRSLRYNQDSQREEGSLFCSNTSVAQITDLYKVPDAVPPIHAVSYHVATDKVPSIDGGKFWSIFSDNLQPIATRGKKARSTLLVDQHCGNGCSIKRAPLSVSYYNDISGGHIGSCRCSEEGLCRPSTTPVGQTHSHSLGTVWRKAQVVGCLSALHSEEAPAPNVKIHPSRIVVPTLYYP